MRKHRLLFLTIVAIILWMPRGTSAQLSRAFGGKVVTTGKQTTALVACTALYGPFTIIPVSSYPIGLYQIPFSTKLGPSTGGWILGKYNIIPDSSTCFNPETGIPVPSFRITNYGVSQRIGF